MVKEVSQGYIELVTTGILGSSMTALSLLPNTDCIISNSLVSSIVVDTDFNAILAYGNLVEAGAGVSATLLTNGDDWWGKPFRTTR